MTSYVLFSLAMSFFLVFPIMMHPLSLGLCILLCSLSSCMLIGTLSYSWFGFVFFLIFVGGLLVMFAYVAALSPNVYFSGNNLFIYFVVLWAVLFFMYYSIFFLDFGILLDDLSAGFSFFNYSAGEKLVVPSHISIMVGLGIVLLLNLLAVVKICYYQRGPLRQHFV
uniref:NADH dehydrogenase subunit 6 n=1 Tax=Chrysomallon squamiferum TaxID=216257 RepID=S6C1C3_CHRSQ|nr:NADH dehydrogenase subunit 6 [Chrysomallon squamiferum]